MYNYGIGYVNCFMSFSMYLIGTQRILFSTRSRAIMINAGRDREYVIFFEHMAMLMDVHQQLIHLNPLSTVKPTCCFLCNTISIKRV